MIRTDALTKRLQQEIATRGGLLELIEAGATISLIVQTDAAGLPKRVTFRIEEQSNASK